MHCTVRINNIYILIILPELIIFSGLLVKNKSNILHELVWQPTVLYTCTTYCGNRLVQKWWRVLSLAASQTPRSGNVTEPDYNIPYSLYLALEGGGGLIGEGALIERGLIYSSKKPAIEIISLHCNINSKSLHSIYHITTTFILTI